MKELKPCKNSLTGKHKWLEKTVKNKGKPDQCILCKQLKTDIEAWNKRSD